MFQVYKIASAHFITECSQGHLHALKHCKLFVHLFGAHLTDLLKTLYNFLSWDFSPFSSLFQHDFFILQNISMDTLVLYKLVCWLQNAMFYKNTQFIVICGHILEGELD